ncbi:hypothetical protein LL240_11205 [Oceanimonas baumannii]|uniref:hypothetical protein n=1 Tax=Oceanimonas baumannii TaxID=129578 RepID=UPI001D18DE12|nr:hypothetical protein [Oceanimonas baumannii]MCC4265013.1 hypothetical protein [Oceanimonas baumannii]
MKTTSLLLLSALVATPALADNILSRAVDFGRELLDETRKLAPGIQNDHSANAHQQDRAHPDDGRDSPALETGQTPVAVSSPTQSGSPAAVVGNSQPASAPPSSNQSWFVEEDHMK